MTVVFVCGEGIRKLKWPEKSDKTFEAIQSAGFLFLPLIL